MEHTLLQRVFMVMGPETVEVEESSVTLLKFSRRNSRFQPLLGRSFSLSSSGRMLFTKVRDAEFPPRGVRKP